MADHLTLEFRSCCCWVNLWDNLENEINVTKVKKGREEIKVDQAPNKVLLVLSSSPKWNYSWKTAATVLPSLKFAPVTVLYSSPITPPWYLDLKPLLPRICRCRRNKYLYVISIVYLFSTATYPTDLSLCDMWNFANFCVTIGSFPLARIYVAMALLLKSSHSSII